MSRMILTVASAFCVCVAWSSSAQATLWYRVEPNACQHEGEVSYFGLELANDPASLPNFGQLAICPLITSDTWGSVTSLDNVTVYYELKDWNGGGDAAVGTLWLTLVAHDITDDDYCECDQESFPYVGVGGSTLDYDDADGDCDDGTCPGSEPTGSWTVVAGIYYEDGPSTMDEAIVRTIVVNGD